MESARKKYPSTNYKTVDELTMIDEGPMDLNFFKEIDPCVHISTEGSQVVEFYRDKSVLITGGLGFIGKLIIEKLLRSCRDLKKIYLPVRAKGQKNVTTRVQEAFEGILFSELKKINPKFMDKVVAVEADLSVPGMAISKEDRQMLEDNVNIVIHGAASVKLAEELRLSAPINIRGTCEIIALIKNCKKLSSFVFISTAYSNSMHKTIEEKVYFTPFTADEILHLIDTEGENLDSRDHLILGRWQNSYSFSKTISEYTVSKECSDMPVCIFRPANITCTYREPLKGWIDNYYGIVGMVALIQRALIRCTNQHYEKFVEICPGDYVANAIIVAAYNNQFNENRNVKVYNFVSSPENPLAQGDIIELALHYGSEMPTCQSIWYPYNIYIRNSYVYLFCSFFLHAIPSYLQDVALVISGRKAKMSSIYQTVNKFTRCTAFAATRQWKHQNDNIQKLWDDLSSVDQQIFSFSLSKSNINWNEYMKILTAGLKLYLYKEDFDTIPKARKHIKRLYKYHIISQIVALFLILLLSFFIYSLF
ncbi:hypothetical protein HHI36_014251 [Cryptolaemus montrouzieri]|uniref:Fatty acyl-CoA reductase n=1 Tax=Cryptolaemus montrouzieri TaxID=559131 RepID=A0ABD2N287_9CUCU